jgi:magnesium transporter
MPKSNRRPRKARYAHKAETAGRLAIANVPVFSSRATASAVQQRFKTTAYEYADLVIVTDDAERYHGVVEFGRLFAADGNVSLSALIRRDWPTVTPETDQEHAAERASAAGVGVLPVVTNDGRAIGVVPPPVLLDVLAREHREDMHRLVGILRERDGALHALEDPPLQRIARRLPWLLVGLVMSTAATAVMAGYESALHANIAIAFFIPALVYLTDAIGTQTEAIAVRGLSLRKKPLAYILSTEILTGGAMGLALGAVAFFGIWAIFGSATIGFGVGLSLGVAGTLASATGLLLPWSLSRLDIDPAFGSGPVATILQDALTILTYFIVMTALLPGPLPS